MKKLLLLLLIAPMIGNSQLLNLPISEVIVISQFNHVYTVPQGKVAQLVSSSYKDPNYVSYNDHSTVTPRLDKNLDASVVAIFPAHKVVFFDFNLLIFFTISATFFV